MSKTEKRALLIGMTIFVVLAVSSCIKAADVEYTTREVVVQEGDTLWGIWEEVGHGRADKWIHEVKSMNEQELSVLRPYQRITVPVIEKGE